MPLDSFIMVCLTFSGRAPHHFISPNFELNTDEHLKDQFNLFCTCSIQMLIGFL